METVNLPLGQSENPASPHYNDQAKLHSQRQAKRFWLSCISQRMIAAGHAGRPSFGMALSAGEQVVGAHSGCVPAEPYPPLKREYFAGWQRETSSKSSA
jgi:hypothetical protein